MQIDNFSSFFVCCFFCVCEICVVLFAGLDFD